ncbi:family 20 glycosylhydrolase [Mucilaginibacter angelicae]|uniref:beta-N-acetylhexosaminidase n=1 Tax=Mucilaginibacter angelicae TaxID=869718 RepID=A0ABV6LBA0_9SPHI
MSKRLTITFLIVLLVGSGNLGYGQAVFNTKDLRIKWAFITNHYQDKPGFLAALTINQTAGNKMPAKGWKLYFSLRYHGINLTSQNKDVVIEHGGGDLFCIKPAASFKGISKGSALIIPFNGGGIIANYHDAPSGFFWVSDSDNLPYDIPESNITHDSGTLKGADAQEIFNLNKGTTNLPDDKLPAFLPQPVTYTQNKGYFKLDKSVSIVNAGGFMNEAGYLAKEISAITSYTPVSAGGRKKIVLRRIGLPKEAYDLRIAADSIIISASDGAGIFYGIQSLKNMLPADAWSSKQVPLNIPCATVHDEPRFSVRAFMLDVSRNFQPKAEIMKLLDVMALYKLNTFHFHFTDDEGWRIEIPGLPELTAIGSNRGYPYMRNERMQPSYGSGASTANKMGSGFYSRNDFIEILQYAQSRHIKVIPEIESPGHARAAVKAMEARYYKYMKAGDRKKAAEYLLSDLQDSSKYLSAQYFKDNVMNPALPSTYRFVAKVVDELKAMYQEAGADLTMIHMGGDEVPAGTWEMSPAIRAMMKKNTVLHNINDVFLSYFKQVQQLLGRRGLKLYAWEELAIGTEKNNQSRKVISIPEFINNGVSVDAWYNVGGNEDIPYQAANAGYKTVLTCIDYFYFDLAYQRSFYEPGDEWLGFLETKKMLSFIPYNYYRNAKVDMPGNPYAAGYFENKQRLTPEGSKNIRGIQGALWGENIKSARQMEYMILPRLLALAEKAWAKQPQWETEQDTAKLSAQYEQYWNIFANQLGKKELPKLAWYRGGYYFRIPAAGLMQLDGLGKANQQFPGMAIRYTTNGAEPGSQSTIYNRPLKLKGKVKMRVFDARGRGGETTTIEVE